MKYLSSSSSLKFGPSAFITKLFCDMESNVWYAFPVDARLARFVDEIVFSNFQATLLLETRKKF